MGKMKFKMFNEAGAHLNGRLTYVAGGAVERGDVVKFDSDGKVVKCTAKADAAIGVALDGSVAGEIVSVAILGSFTGTVVVKAGGAVTRGAKVTAEGKAATAGDKAVGVALDAATAAGDLIEVAHCVQTDGGAAAGS